ncbi:hypothetical protein BH09SUM1_BH09SUM1_10710 [soil metagenome]
MKTGRRGSVYFGNGFDLGGCARIAGAKALCFVRRGLTVNGKPPLASLAAALVFIAGQAFAAPYVTHQVKLPGYSRSVTYNTSSSVIAASAALKGVAFISVKGDKPSLIAQYPEWTSLFALPLKDGAFLLADRFGMLRLIAPSGGGYREIQKWQTEGIPTNLALADGRLYVAAGAAGFLAYDWNGGEKTPELRGRFPFVDYSKEIALGDRHEVYLADNLETGLQILDLKDIERPRLLSREHAGFVDSVSRYGKIVAISSRREGAMLYDSSDSAALRRMGILEPLTRSDHKAPDLRSVVFAPNGDLLVCEGLPGARVLSVKPEGNGVTMKELLKYDATGVGDGLFLPDKVLVLSTEDGRLIFLDRE